MQLLQVRRLLLVGGIPGRWSTPGFSSPNSIAPVFRIHICAARPRTTEIGGIDSQEHPTTVAKSIDNGPGGRDISRTASAEL